MIMHLLLAESGPNSFIQYLSINFKNPKHSIYEKFNKNTHTDGLLVVLLFGERAGISTLIERQ
jgi:hypothetical protein